MAAFCGSVALAAPVRSLSRSVEGAESRGTGAADAAAAGRAAGAGVAVGDGFAAGRDSAAAAGVAAGTAASEGRLPGRGELDGHSVIATTSTMHAVVTPAIHRPARDGRAPIRVLSVGGVVGGVVVVAVVAGVVAAGVVTGADAGASVRTGSSGHAEISLAAARIVARRWLRSRTIIRSIVETTALGNSGRSFSIAIGSRWVLRPSTCPASPPYGRCPVSIS